MNLGMMISLASKQFTSMAITNIPAGLRQCEALRFVRQHEKIENHYVAPDGSDTNPGTEEAPFRTVRQGTKRAGPGDTVYIRAGTYDLSRLTLVETTKRFT
jgi:hypothetical protein